MGEMGMNMTGWNGSGKANGDRDWDVNGIGWEGYRINQGIRRILVTTTVTWHMSIWPIWGLLTSDWWCYLGFRMDCATAWSIYEEPGPWVVTPDGIPVYTDSPDDDVTQRLLRVYAVLQVEGTVKRDFLPFLFHGSAPPGFLVSLQRWLSLFLFTLKDFWKRTRVIVG